MAKMEIEITDLSKNNNILLILFFQFFTKCNFSN